MAVVARYLVDTSAAARMRRGRVAQRVSLLVAAVAEQHRITVLHYDSDYDAICEFSGLQAQWVVERGEID